MAADGTPALEAIVRRVRALGGASTEVAKIAAPLVRDAVRATAAAGTSPDGKAWPAKKDGKPALVNAAAAVQCEAVESVVQLRLDGTSTGSAQVQAIQNRERPILPVPGAPIPVPIMRAIDTAASRFFDRTVGR